MPFTGLTATTTAMSSAEATARAPTQHQPYRQSILLHCNRIRVGLAVDVHGR